MNNEAIIETIIKRVRERIRSITPGELPPMRETHPIMGLINDVRRLIRRKLLGFTR